MNFYANLSTNIEPLDYPNRQRTRAKEPAKHATKDEIGYIPLNRSARSQCSRGENTVCASTLHKEVETLVKETDCNWRLRVGLLERQPLASLDALNKENKENKE